jgi:chemotaxis protein histidine kinase CheA|tara:strand:+ start:1820 stop:2092 length:273 start_codon:yes stop_codon:yes gene_type:complete
MEDFDNDEWAEMQEMYIKHTSKELDKIKLDSDSLDAIRTFGHNIKGSGGMYGFDEVTNIGLQIENAAKESDLDSIKLSLSELGDFLKSKM